MCKHACIKMGLNQYIVMPFSSFLLVLTDPQSRAIYDLFGKKGLEVEGWEVRLAVSSHFIPIPKWAGRLNLTLAQQTQED